MTYTEQGARVTLEMTRDDFQRLTLMLGYAVGAVSKNEGCGNRFWNWIRFVNDLNSTNANFTPYEIPEQHNG